MNFESLQKSWQNQETKISLNPGLLLKEVRRNQQQFRATIFWRDFREVGVGILLFGIFLIWGLRSLDWTICLMAFACLWVAIFIVVDRFMQYRKRPAANDTLKGCIESSLHQVNHQIWLLKNVFWWYLLPLDVTWGIFVACSAWHDRHSGLSVVIGWIVYAIFGVLMTWGLYWLNQLAVRKNLVPRRQELEKLLDEIEPDDHTSTMKTNKPLGLWLMVLVVCAIAVAAYAAMKTNSVANPIPATSLEAIRKRHNLPALAVVVTKDGQICDRMAVGVRKWDDPTPVTTNDVFHIGSCTKSMTATLTAILIEQGKLRWDTTIAEVFPEFKGKMDKQYEAVTVEQLLHHRGGVPGDPPSAAWKRAWQQVGTPTQQRREFIEAVLREPPAAAPGTKMIYSNQGYAIVGAMLEKITGQDYETLIAEKLFKPLHMDTAGFGPPGTTDKVDQPWGHVHKLFMTIPIQLDNPPAIAPAGRVHCSLDDLARYAMFHLQEKATNGLLKPETLLRLHTPDGTNITDPTENYACGWVVLQRGWAGGRTLWHNGSNTMWYIVMWLAPNKNFSVIVATNIAGSDAEDGCDEAATAMIKKWLPE